MSSYFDAAAGEIAIEIERGNRARAAELAKSAYARVDEYLKWVTAHALKGESFKVENLVKRFKLLDRDSAETRPLEFVVWELHDMGHEIGRASVALRGGYTANDNPYFPGHRDTPGDRVGGAK